MKNLKFISYNMQCPKCGSTMSCGVTHEERPGLQYECHNCGTIIQK